MRRFWAFTILWLVAMPAFLGVSGAQSVPPFAISGHVTDAASGLPLANVNVFLANTTLGAVTDAAGRYNIRGVPVGTYELVASLLGYEMQRSSVRVTAADAAVDLRLTPTTLAMGEVEVLAAPDREWQKNFQRFEILFWGDRYDDRQCKILNPEVLDFVVENEPHCFLATASRPLRLENRYLGYRAEFILQEFRFYLDSEEIKYAFIPKFEAMSPAEASEERRWSANRRQAYRGSLRHFLAALIAGRLAQEKYTVTLLPNLPWQDKPSRPQFPTADFSKMLLPTAISTEVEFDFSGCLEIHYLPENQKSWLVANREFVLLNTAGYAYDTYAFMLYGYWFNQRAAEMLPWDYQP